MSEQSVEVEFVVRRKPKAKPFFKIGNGKLKVVYEMTQEDMDQALEQFNLQMRHEANKS